MEAVYAEHDKENRTGVRAMLALNPTTEEQRELHIRLMRHFNTTGALYPVGGAIRSGNPEMVGLLLESANPVQRALAVAAHNFSTTRLSELFTSDRSDEVRSEIVRRGFDDHPGLLQKILKDPEDLSLPVIYALMQGRRGNAVAGAPLREADWLPVEKVALMYTNITINARATEWSFESLTELLNTPAADSANGTHACIATLLVAAGQPVGVQAREGTPFQEWDTEEGATEARRVKDMLDGLELIDMELAAKMADLQGDIRLILRLLAQGEQAGQPLNRSIISRAGKLILVGLREVGRGGWKQYPWFVSGCVLNPDWLPAIQRLHTVARECVREIVMRTEDPRLGFDLLVRRPGSLIPYWIRNLAVPQTNWGNSFAEITQTKQLVTFYRYLAERSAQMSDAGLAMLLNEADTWSGDAQSLIEVASTLFDEQ